MGNLSLPLPPPGCSPGIISKSHNDVSRTPSETLAAEFAEYVTLRKASTAAATALGKGNVEYGYLAAPTSPFTKLSMDDYEFSLEQILRDPGYNSKVEFALRLGYTEAQLQRALLKIGQAAGQNQILEELIRLQKSKPDLDGGGVKADEIAIVAADVLASVAAAAQASEASSAAIADSSSNATEKKGKKKSSVVAASSLASALTKSVLSGQVSSSIESITGAISSSDDPILLPIVVDGSNLAMSHGNKDVFSCKGIWLCVSWFQMRGHKDITVFVPKWRKESSRPDAPIRDQHLLTELEKDRLLSFTPSRQVGGRRFVCHDDRYILNLAAQTSAIVVSNDNYRDLINEKPEFKKVIEEKILMYSFVNDRFMPPDDPLGRNGPTLDQFLRRRPSSSSQTSSSSFGLLGLDQQPCPYGKKCTYGNKCKFFHAERGNQPQKSVTDKIKEHSSQKINEVRARTGTTAAHSRESSPGDPLTRTRSMQPLLRAESSLFAQEKEALCRTRSTVPRLSLPPPPPPIQNQQMLQNNPATPEKKQPNYWPMPPPTTSTVDSSFGGGGGGGFEQDQQHQPQQQQPLWSSQFNLGQLGTTASSLPDTSMPPPPPRAPWSHEPIVTSVSTASSDGGGGEPIVASTSTSNQHRKLARQLTINPYDQSCMSVHRGIPFPPPTSIPPPSLHHGHHPHHHHLLQQQQQQHHGDHAAVTRNASAPEQSYQSQPPALSFAQQQATIHLDQNFAFEQQQARGQQQQLQQQQQQQQQHPHLQRMSSTSDSQLNKTLSQPVAAVQQQQHLVLPVRMPPSAVSPLIGSSDGVWETAESKAKVSKTGSGSDLSEARSNMYYHLAALFPEDQVLTAMRAMPEETNPQKICSYILALNQSKQ